MPGQLLIEYLQRRDADYTCQYHEVAYRAPDIARLSCVQGGSFAKVVMIKIDGELAMMVVPAHDHVDLDGVRGELGVDNIVLASEREFGRRFPRCEIGAMPPFGHLYGLQTLMAENFPLFGDIAFNAGNHSEIIKMPLGEYLRLAFVTIVSDAVIARQRFTPKMPAALGFARYMPVQVAV